MAAEGPGFGKIDHFFVLMLENRSFDHMFGADPHSQPGDPLPDNAECPLDPASPQNGAVPVRFQAPDSADPDPPHEFADVHYQITGRFEGEYAADTPQPMNGFAASARYGLLEGESEITKALNVNQRSDGAYALEGQGLDSTPVLRTLAKEFALCEDWYSSMPGPTWPNRFFIHAASSGGLTNSPSAPAMGAVLIDRLGFAFERGTIYGALGDGNWRIYHGDALPQVLAIKGMARRYVGGDRDHFRRIHRLRDDLQQPEFAPQYVFIEPNHSIFTNSRRCNSQHPPGRVTAGEKLIKQVFDAISQSPHWHRSALVIVYDEHGGFYDHRSPPPAVPPGDAPLNADQAGFPHRFAFDRLGVRVPAVVVSPWIKAGTIDPQRYDHSSVLKTVQRRFGKAALTGRDAAANDLAHLFALAEPRADIPQVFVDGFSDSPPFPDDDEFDDDHGAEEDDWTDHGESSDDDLAPGSLAGFLRIAVMVDHLKNEQEATLTQKLFHYLLGGIVPAAAITRVPEVATRQDARRYIRKVALRMREDALARVGNAE